jgi:hypothetical protein
MKHGEAPWAAGWQISGVGQGRKGGVYAGAQASLAPWNPTESPQILTPARPCSVDPSGRIPEALPCRGDKDGDGVDEESALAEHTRSADMTWMRLDIRQGGQGVSTSATRRTVRDLKPETAGGRQMVGLRFGQKNTELLVCRLAPSSNRLRSRQDASDRVALGLQSISMKH